MTTTSGRPVVFVFSDYGFIFCYYIQFPHTRCAPNLTVGFSNTLDFVLLLDGVAVGRTLGGVDQFVSQALRDALHAAEGRFARASGEQVDGGVNTTQRRNVDGLSADGTGRTDTGRVFTRTRVDDSLNQDLERVLTRQEVDNLEAVFDDLNLLETKTKISESDSIADENKIEGEKSLWLHMADNYRRSDGNK